MKCENIVTLAGSVVSSQPCGLGSNTVRAEVGEKIWSRTARGGLGCSVGYN